MRFSGGFGPPGGEILGDLEPDVQNSQTPRHLAGSTEGSFFGDFEGEFFVWRGVCSGPKTHGSPPERGGVQGGVFRGLGGEGGDHSPLFEIPIRELYR